MVLRAGLGAGPSGGLARASPGTGAGCQAASASYSQIDHNFADLMQGLFMFSILAAGFFSNFKIVRTGGKNR